MRANAPPDYYRRYAHTLGELVQLAEELFDTSGTAMRLSIAITCGANVETDGMIVGGLCQSVDGEVRYACIGPGGDAMYSVHEFDAQTSIPGEYEAVVEMDWSAYGAAKTFMRHVGMRPTAEAMACL